MAASGSGYRLRPRADDDLEQIWLYTKVRWSLEQADSYVGMLVDAFEGLAAGTKSGRVADVREGYMKYAVGSHVIYFTRSGSVVEIVRVLHARMDVDRHL